MIVLKYLSWLLTSLLAISGGWFFKFTEDVGEGRKKLTKQGRIALPFALAGFALAITLTVVEDVEKAAGEREAEEAKIQAEIDQQQLQNQITGLQTSINTVLAALEHPEVIEGLASTSEGQRELSSIAADPEIQELARTRPEVARVLDSIADRLGGKPLVLDRLRAENPDTTISQNDIGVVASFSLRRYDVDSSEETHTAVIQTIRGMEADVLLLQEVQGEDALDRLMEDLPEFWPELSLHALGNMQTAILTRLARVDTIGDVHEIEGNFVRTPITQTVRMRDVTFEVVSVHLKSQFRGQESTARRAQEVNAIVDWIDRRDLDIPIVIAGVFQVESDAVELQPLIDAGGVFTSDDIEDGISTYISTRFPPIKMSHIVLFDGIQDAYIPNSCHVYELPKLLPEWAVERIADQISDHNPISVVLDLRQTDD